MSLEPILWAMHDSPAADTTERLILSCLADKADADGCNAFPSRRTMARVALCDVKTVQRKLAKLLERGVIALGDQAAARYIPEHVRPKVYDLLIPAAWYGPDRLARVNDDRGHRGLRPLTAESRPSLAPAPAKLQRADKGKPRSKGPAEERGDSQSPLSDGGGGDSQSRGGGDSQSPEGGLSVPQSTPVTLPSQETHPEAPVRPSVRNAGDVRATDGAGTDGRTDGGELDGGQGGPGGVTGDATPERSANGSDDERGPTGRKAAEPVELTPGVEVLLAIAQEFPELLLTGDTLRNQGDMVTGMLGDGWTPAQIQHVVAGRPLPDRIEKSVGAIVSARLAAAGPPPGSVRPIPAQVPCGPSPHGDTANRAGQAELPMWCGWCGDGADIDGSPLNPAILHNPKLRLVDGKPCLSCHPAAARDGALSTGHGRDAFADAFTATYASEPPF